MPGTSSTNGPRRRVTSMRPCDSILMTSAPRWASCIAANGPAHTHVRSITRRPASGAAVAGRADRRGRAWCPVDRAVVARRRRQRRGRGPAPARRTGSATAAPRHRRRVRPRGSGTTRGRAAAPRRGRRPRRGRGTPGRRRRAPSSRNSSTVKSATAAATSASTASYCSDRWAVVANTSRWPQSGSPSIPTRARHWPSSVHCTSTDAVAQRVDPPRAHGAVAARHRHQPGVGDRRQARRHRRHHRLERGHVDALPAAVGEAGVQRAERGDHRVAGGEHLGQLAAVAHGRHRSGGRVRRDHRQHGALGEGQQVEVGTVGERPGAPARRDVDDHETRVGGDGPVELGVGRTGRPDRAGADHDVGGGEQGGPSRRVRPSACRPGSRRRPRCASGRRRRRRTARAGAARGRRAVRR